MPSLRYDVCGGYLGLYNPLRFTPTCVGNTPCSPSRPHTSSVHPHVCGEYINPCTSKFGQVGSPPRVWGILGRRRCRLRRVRFTPTCVGNTLMVSSAPLPRTVHPHVCGEYYFTSISRSAINGSPPRVWGILFVPRSNCE